MHPGRHIGYHRGPAARIAYLPRTRVRGTRRGQSARAVRTGAVRPRLPDARREHAYVLPGRYVLLAAERGRTQVRRSATRAEMAAAGRINLSEGRPVENAG